MLFLRGGAGLGLRNFYMDGGVPADDDLTSLTARSGAPGGLDWRDRIYDHALERGAGRAGRITGGAGGA